MGGRTICASAQSAAANHQQRRLRSSRSRRGDAIWSPREQRVQASARVLTLVRVMCHSCSIRRGPASPNGDARASRWVGAMTAARSGYRLRAIARNMEERRRFPIWEAYGGGERCWIESRGVEEGRRRVRAPAWVLELPTNLLGVCPSVEEPLYERSVSHKPRGGSHGRESAAVTTGDARLRGTGTALVCALRWSTLLSGGSVGQKTAPARASKLAQALWRWYRDVER